MLIDGTAIDIPIYDIIKMLFVDLQVLNLVYRIVLSQHPLKKKASKMILKTVSLKIVYIARVVMWSFFATNIFSCVENLSDMTIISVK